jgi:hypothetical protein
MEKCFHHENYSSLLLAPSEMEYEEYSGREQDAKENERHMLDAVVYFGLASLGMELGWGSLVRVVEILVHQHSPNQ